MSDENSIQSRITVTYQIETNYNRNRSTSAMFDHEKRTHSRQYPFESCHRQFLYANAKYSQWPLSSTSLMKLCRIGIKITHSAFRPRIAQIQTFNIQAVPSAVYTYIYSTRFWDTLFVINAIRILRRFKSTISSLRMRVVSVCDNGKR